jgi:hypothetical protein
MSTQLVAFRPPLFLRIHVCDFQSMEDPMAREEKLITYLHTAQQAAEDRYHLA